MFGFSVLRSKSTWYYSDHDRDSRFQQAIIRQADDVVGRGMRLLLPLDSALGKSHWRYGGVPSVSRGLVGFSSGGRGGLQKSSAARSTRRTRIFGRPRRAQITRYWRPCPAASCMVRTFANLPWVGGFGLSLRGRKPLVAPKVLTVCSVAALVSQRFDDRRC